MITHDCLLIISISTCYLECAALGDNLVKSYSSRLLLVQLVADKIIASIIQALRCGATVCRTHLHLDAEWGFHCDENYVCA